MGCVERRPTQCCNEITWGVSVGQVWKGVTGEGTHDLFSRAAGSVPPVRCGKWDVLNCGMFVRLRSCIAIEKQYNTIQAVQRRHR